MTQRRKEGDLIELNLFWPDFGVIHLKFRSEGLLNFVSHLGMVYLFTICSGCKENARYLTDFADSKADDE